MATQLTKNTVAEVFVDEPELVNLLGAKALEAGLIDFTPDAVDLMRSSDGSVQGWKITFSIGV
jgi:hypothetical protein